MQAVAATRRAPRGHRRARCLAWRSRYYRCRLHTAEWQACWLPLPPGARLSVIRERVAWRTEAPLS